MLNAACITAPSCVSKNIISDLFNTIHTIMLTSCMLNSTQVVEAFENNGANPIGPQECRLFFAANKYRNFETLDNGILRL